MKAGKTLMELATEIERRAGAKRDLVVSTKHLSLRPLLGPDGEPIGGVRLDVAGREAFDINAIAHGQIAEQADIPRRYYDRMLTDAPRLLATNVDEWFQRYPTPRTVRTLDGVNRALLSDKYRPLENEDLAQAVLPPLIEMGLDVMSSEITDRRLYIKAVDPKVTRELTAIGGKFGDGGHRIVRCLAPAITISNSEVGLGALSILGGVYDGFCSNLATFGERSMRKYHVGKKNEIVGDDVYALLSDETRRLTDKAMWAQVGDVVRAAFDRAKFDALCGKIAETQEQKIEGDPVQVVTLTARRFGMNETEEKSVLRHLIEGADLTRFGLYNAVTEAAQDAVLTYDRATEFERFGAQVIELSPKNWRELTPA